MRLKGVSIKVSENFYREMEKARRDLRKKNINIKSHTEFTELMLKNNPFNMRRRK